MGLVVTGASGELGRSTIDALLRIVDARALILVTRHPDALRHYAALGACVRHGDFDEPASLGAAFAGASRLLLISTVQVGEARRRQHEAAIRAAIATPGLEHIVYTSSAGIHPRNPCFVIPDHIFTERLLAESGLAFTILRMNSYADILATQIAPQAIRTGQWIGGAGDGAVGFVAKRDCAATAAAVLTGEGHEGAIYEITGPELLSHRQASALAAELAGKPIDYVVPPDAPPAAIGQAEDEQAATWIGPFTLADLSTFDDAVRAGYYAICTHHVEMITGRPAQTLRDLFLAHLDLLRSAA